MQIRICCKRGRTFSLGNDLRLHVFNCYFYFYDSGFSERFLYFSWFEGSENWECVYDLIAAGLCRCMKIDTILLLSLQNSISILRITSLHVHELWMLLLTMC